MGCSSFLLMSKASWYAPWELSIVSVEGEEEELREEDTDSAARPPHGGTVSCAHSSRQNPLLSAPFFQSRRGANHCPALRIQSVHNAAGLSPA